MLVLEGSVSELIHCVCVYVCAVYPSLSATVITCFHQCFLSAKIARLKNPQCIWECWQLQSVVNNLEMWFTSGWFVPLKHCILFTATFKCLSFVLLLCFFSCWIGKVEKMASLYNIHVRTGCFCNTGACQMYLGISDEDIQKNLQVSFWMRLCDTLPMENINSVTQATGSEFHEGWQIWRGEKKI